MLVKKETLLSMQQTENKAPKNNGKPYYDGRSGKWKLDIPDFGTEKGDLAYIACEFVRTSLYHPFHYGEPPQEGEFEAHSHSFSGALQYLLQNPENFSLEGHEEYYSAQEIELINAFRKKLIEADQN